MLEKDVMKVELTKKQLQDANEKLKEEVFRLKSVIENLPGSIYWKDKAGTYFGCNTYTIEKMQSAGFEGYKSKSSFIGKTDYDIFSKDIAERYRKNDLDVMEHGKESSLEEPITLSNGKKMVQLSTKKPLYNKKGEVSGVVGNTVDITRLKEIEDELRKAKEKAEQSDFVKTEFMRNMEHDIRTPFSGIWSMGHYLWEMEEDEVKKEYLYDIVQCAKELLDYCNGILDFSKVESGTLAVVDKKFNLQKLACSVMKMEQPIATHKKLDLQMSYDEKIPVVLLGDSHRIYRILINLISNAVKFTKVGRVALDVSLLKAVGDSVLIRFIIEDTGVGIPGDKQEYIFEKFSRLSLSNKGVYKGIGIGLRAVKQFMHEIGGEIDLISDLGKGTKFICTIPFDLPLTEDFVD